MGVSIVKILLLIVLSLGLVLILGYHRLTFGFLHLKNESKVDEVQFNFKRGSATQKPAPSVSSLFDDEPEDEPFFNRTAEAQNQNVVFFNRVPKTGSEMFQVRLVWALNVLRPRPHPINKIPAYFFTLSNHISHVTNCD